MFAWKIFRLSTLFLASDCKGKRAFGGTPLHLSGFADEYIQNEEKRGQILRISYEFQNHYTPTTRRGFY